MVMVMVMVMVSDGDGDCDGDGDGEEEEEEKVAIHGGTKAEGKCSYPLPRAVAAGSNGTNKAQILRVAVDEIARFLVYRMYVTRSQLSANTGILICLVREIWQFKVFTGKEVTPLQEEGNS